jgi:hypothetical protein
MSDTVIPGDPFGPIKRPRGQDQIPARQVNQFHDNSDCDSFAGAQHHTLGIKHDQASPGDHKHDGVNSKKLLDGATLTGAKGGNVALGNLITMLADLLGFEDNTT